MRMAKESPPCDYCDSEPCSCLFCEYCGWDGFSSQGRWIDASERDFVMSDGDRICRTCAGLE